MSTINEDTSYMILSPKVVVIMGIIGIIVHIIFLYTLTGSLSSSTRVEEDIPNIEGFTDFIEFSKSMASYYLDNGECGCYTEFNVSFGDGYTVSIKVLYGCCGYSINSTLYCNKTLVTNYWEGEIGEYKRFRHRVGKVYNSDLFKVFVEKHLGKG